MYFVNEIRFSGATTHEERPKTDIDDNVTLSDNDRA
jgi:hypothetical protein